MEGQSKMAHDAHETTVRGWGERITYKVKGESTRYDNSTDAFERAMRLAIETGRIVKIYRIKEFISDMNSWHPGRAAPRFKDLYWATDGHWVRRVRSSKDVVRIFAPNDIQG